jgi:hypothetical protein
VSIAGSSTAVATRGAVGQPIATDR